MSLKNNKKKSIFSHWSLCKNIEAITDRLAELKKQPSILFISETKVQDSKLETQEPQIQIEGYTFELHNSPTDAGGTAIYISADLEYNNNNKFKLIMPLF